MNFVDFATIIRCGSFPTTFALGKLKAHDEACSRRCDEWRSGDHPCTQGRPPATIEGCPVFG